MPKIVFTVTTDLTYDQRMERICSTLANNGYDVLLIGRKKNDSIPLKEKSYKQSRLNCFFQKGKFFYIEYNIRLFLRLLFEKTDIISSVDLDTILPGWIISKIRNKKFVYDSHEYFTEVIEVVNRPAIKKMWEQVEALVLNRIDYAYTVSESLKYEFEKKYKVQFEVIRNVPFQKTIPTPAYDEKVLIYIGVVNEGRGLELLLEVLKEVDIKLWICGKGDIYEQLVERTKFLKLEERVTFFGFIEPAGLKQLTEKAYAGYLMLEKESLSYYYSLANKFFDYIHAGIPQIVIDFPEYRLINENIEVAVLTQLTKESIKENLLKLWDDEILYQRLKSNTELAGKEYNWENESVKLLQIYKTVAES